MPSTPHIGGLSTIGTVLGQREGRPGAFKAHPQPKDYGVEPHSVVGVITSPPYLCVADYTLGQRLS
jgi:hypothetical protein